MFNLINVPGALSHFMFTVFLCDVMRLSKYLISMLGMILCVRLLGTEIGARVQRPRNETLKRGAKWKLQIESKNFHSLGFESVMSRRDLCSQIVKLC